MSIIAYTLAKMLTVIFLLKSVEFFLSDSFVNFLNLENKTIQYIKIDIEGSEFEAICGASNVLENDNPVIARSNIIQMLIVMMNLLKLSIT